MTVTRYQQDKYLPEIKEVRPEYFEVYSQVLQDVLKRLDKAYQAFFRRIKQGSKAGFPRFQGKYRYDSFTYPQYKASVADDAKHIYLPKVGNVRIRLSRPLEGSVKTLSIKRDACGDWWAVFTCEVTAQPLPASGASVGIDRGITALIATSDGELVDNPKHFTKAEKALRKAQRRLARRKKGSTRREKARLVVAKLHRKTQRQRLDFIHKLTTHLVKHYDLIALEDLNVQGMSRSKLAKHILDAGWSTLMQQLDYKAEYAGRQVIKVNPAYTSQTCAACGHVGKDNRRTQARFECRSCGHTANADINAAQNILARAEPSGANVVVGNACVA